MKDNDKGHGRGGREQLPPYSSKSAEMPVLPSDHFLHKAERTFFFFRFFPTKTIGLPSKHDFKLIGIGFTQNARVDFSMARRKDLDAASATLASDADTALPDAGSVMTTPFSFFATKTNKGHQARQQQGNPSDPTTRQQQGASWHQTTRQQQGASMHQTTRQQGTSFYPTTRDVLASNKATRDIFLQGNKRQLGIKQGNNKGRLGTKQGHLSWQQGTSRDIFLGNKGHQGTYLSWQQQQGNKEIQVIQQQAILATLSGFPSILAPRGIERYL